MKKMELCKGRHEIPEAKDGAIFENAVDPLDVDGLEREASSVLDDVRELVLYVTGLTVALVAVINVCKEKRIDLTLMHYDRESGDYYPQKVR